MDNINHPSKIKLKIAYWYVTHKTLLKRASLFLMSLALLLLVGYGVYGFTIHFSTISESDEILNSLSKNPINFEAYQIRMKPAPLSVKSVDFIKTNQNEFDFIAEVKNFDKRWLIKKITYQFVSNNFSSAVYEDFILPNQSKFLFALNQSPKTAPANLSLNIIKVERQRVKSDFDASLNDFFIENIKFLQAGDLSQGMPRVKFQATNNSLYNFWEVPFKIILYSRSALAGANIASLTQFKSEETRFVELVWFDEIKQNITKVIVVPDINLFDEENFMPADKETGELK